jgi:ABC-2 type transport system ATP-binding protein
MRQRLSLAAALLGDPPILILDEPGNGLDPQGIHDLRSLLRERAGLGHTVFVSSHLLSEVEHLADDVVVVSRGRLVTTGALAELQRTTVTVRTPQPQRLVELLTGAGASVDRTAPDTMEVRGLDAAAVGTLAAGASVVLHELTPGAGSLEELFLRWTSDKPEPPEGTRSPSQGSPATNEKEVVRS